MVVNLSGKQQVDVEPLDNSVVVNPSGKQQVDVEPLDNSVVVNPSGKQQVDVEPVDNPVVVKPSGKCRFAQPQREKDIQAVKKSRVPKKTLQNTEWAQGIWREWATYRLEQPLSAENYWFRLDSDITKMSTPAVL